MADFVRSTKPNSITIGDLNFPGIDWELGSYDGASENFFKATQDAFLTQHVDIPTQDAGNILDVILSTNPNLISSVNSAGKLGASDHLMLLIDINCSPKLSTSSEMVQDYSKADFPQIHSDLASIDWFDHLDPLSAQAGWDKFKEILNDTVNKSIPLKLRRSSARPLWMNNNILSLIRKKRRLWSWYQSCCEYAELAAFKKVQKAVDSTIRNAKRNLERKLAKNVKKI